MKKMLWVSMATLMLFVFCGCTKEDNKVTDTEVGTTQAEDITFEEVKNEVTSTESTTESETITIEITEESIVEEVESTKAEKLVDSESASTNEDPYVGEYNSYVIDEPNLEIQKNDDGTYKIQIGIFRLIGLYNCVGEYTDDGLTFFTDEMGENGLSGIITVEDDVATVKFTCPSWNAYSEVTDYQYYKTSDIPNIDTLY